RPPSLFLSELDRPREAQNPATTPVFESNPYFTTNRARAVPPRKPQSIFRASKHTVLPETLSELANQIRFHFNRPLYPLKLTQIIRRPRSVSRQSVFNNVQQRLDRGRGLDGADILD